MNAFRGGFEAVLGPRTTFNAQPTRRSGSISSADEEPGPRRAGLNLLQGGHSHGGHRRAAASASHAASRSAPTTRRSAPSSAGGAETFDVQSALAVSRDRAEAVGVGVARLRPRLADRRPRRLARQRSGRSTSASTGRAATAAARCATARTFLPSFGFGGTFQNEELRATLTHRAEPLGGLVRQRRRSPTTTRSSRRSHAAVACRRRRRSAGSSSAGCGSTCSCEHVSQDSQLAGGHVLRTRAGVQATVSQTVRATR